MTKPRYLSKSRFKLGLECPTKLYYQDKPKIYANDKIDDPFLQALADGGFQVGALAQCYYPGGVEIETLDYEKAKNQTDELLKQENVVIFEAAVQVKNYFIRIDILEKKGNVLNLIEVKSKSVDPETFKDEWWDKKLLKKNIHKLKSDWRSYLYDVAFQTFVTRLAFPNYQVNPKLMCADLTKFTSVEGLNQKFLLRKTDPKRTKVELRGDVSPAALGEPVLTALNVDEVVDLIISGKDKSLDFEGGFSAFAEYLASHYEKDQKIKPEPDQKCKKCEFRTKNTELKSGFNECWKNAFNLEDDELKKPFVFDVWNFKGAPKLMEEGTFLMEEITQDKFEIKESDEWGLSMTERQWLQITKEIENDSSVYFDKDGLDQERLRWKYPLHMIDFETCMVAIPFNKNRHPYEQIAFQFSHHVIYADGRVEHKDEYINTKLGFFPNFEFVRALKKALETDQGTIFRYSYHENSVLNQILDQLIESNEPDKEELISWIKTVTIKKGDKKEEILWEGERIMVDLCEMVKKYYFHPSTKGSNSIKFVLPAILKDSNYLKEKYGQPTYNSKNFKNKKWIEFDSEGKVKDPYKMLDGVFMDYKGDEIDRMFEDEVIGNGGAALMAYAMMQFTEMGDVERERIREALLRYCELDTLAMVMIVEAWNNF
jgi:hypothetical protein